MSSERSYAYRAILLFGVVSFLGDLIYEGARGIVPSYLAYLGASALLIGLISGVSEFLGLSLRLVTGILTDVTRSYWTLYAFGYILLISIPLLGFSDALPFAVALIIIERVAKAIRSPARDALISFLSKSIGAGKSFGIHEALDQFGAILGPLIMGITLSLTSNSYSMTFPVTFIPYAFLILSVLYVYRNYSHVTPVRELSNKNRSFNYSAEFWLYNISVLLNTIGLIHISLLVLSSSKAFNPVTAAFIYTLIQGIDMFSALIAGFMYDKLGRAFLFLPFTLSVIPSALTLLGGQLGLIAAAVIYGFILGMQESIYRAAISGIVPDSQRGSAYGIFNTFYGIGSLASAAAFGYFIDRALILHGLIFTLITQTLASFTLLLSLRVKTNY